MENEPAFKRRQYLVDPAYQLRFVKRLFMVILAVAVLACLITSGLLWRNLYLPDQENGPVLITSALIAVSLTLLIELLIAIPLIFVLGIRQTHRVIGPINRMKRTLEAIGSGDFSQRISLRKGDVLEQLGQTINQMAEQLQRLPR